MQSVLFNIVIASPERNIILLNADRLNEYILTDRNFNYNKRLESLKSLYNNKH